MHVVMADINSSLLEKSVAEVKKVTGAGEITPVVVDVSKMEEVVKLKEKVLDLHGEIAILMNNVSIDRYKSSAAESHSLMVTFRRPS
jgi:NAD(P)-dependent dehydrogenase (short-subunit alcohol dehydrogenase family)